MARRRFYPLTPDERRRAIPASAVAFTIATIAGLLLTGYKHFDHVARGYPIPLRVPLIEEMTAAYGAVALLYALVRRYARRVRFMTASLAFTLLAHAAG